MISFSATILKFDNQGEKTGWTYISIPAAIAEQLMPNNKKSFRVKGKLDEHPIHGIALIPMGEGDFIMALNAVLRKSIGKRKGAILKAQLAVDKIPYQLNAGLMECMQDERPAFDYFKMLPPGHQNYFSKWVESSKTESTRDKRIAQAISALSRKMGFTEMIRENQL